MAKTTKANQAAVADICLYGNRDTGSGFIVALADGRMFGDGRPVAGRSFTEAVWLAVDLIRDAGVQDGRGQVFHPGGDFVSDIDLGGIVPSYGALQSRPAPVYVIPVDALMAAAASTDGRN